MGLGRKFRNRALPLVGALAVGLIVVPGGSSGAQTPVPGFAKSFLPSTIGPGSVSTLTFTIDNTANPSPATSMAFTDTLPAAITIASPANAKNTCGGTLSAPGGGGVISLVDGAVGAGVSCTISVDVTASAAGAHTNESGPLTSSAGASGAATAVLTVDTGRPGFSKAFAPASVDLGERSTLTFTIDNTANASDVTSLAFTDPLPVGLVIADPADASTDCVNPLLGVTLTAAPGTSVVSLSSGLSSFLTVVPAGATCTVVVDVVATAGGQQANVSGHLTARVGGVDRNSGGANASLDVTVAALHLTKQFTDDPVAPGDGATLRFTITNFSRADSATGVTFSDDLDAALSGLTAVGPLPADPCGPGSTLAGTSVLTLTGGTLAPGATCVFDVTVAVPASSPPGSWVNTTGAVSGTVGGEGLTGNAASDTLFVVAAPVLTKQFIDDPVGAGSPVTLEFTITDTTATGGSTDIAFTDELTDSSGTPGSAPGLGLPFPVTASLPADGFCGLDSTMSLVSAGTDRQELSVTGASLAAGASCTFSVVVTVPAGTFAGRYQNTTSPITATVDGEAVTGNRATDELLVVGAPPLIKAFVDDPIESGGTVELRFTVSNGGESAPDFDAVGTATAISFTDDLTFVSGLTATGLPLVEPCGPGSSLAGSAGDTLLTFTGGTLFESEECTFSVVLQSSASTPQGTSTNTTSAVSAVVEGVAVIGRSASDDLTVANVRLSKAFTDDPVAAGDPVTLEFTIANTSPVDATDVTFVDDLDDVVDGLAAQPGQLPAAACGGTLSGSSSLFFSGGTVPAGTSCSFSVVLDVPVGALARSYPNATSSGAASLDGELVALAPATDLLVVEQLGVGLVKEFVDDPVEPGDNVILRFTLSNPSQTTPLAAITFTDDLAAALTGLTAVGLPISVCGGTLSGSNADTFLTFTGGSLAPGASCSFDVTLSVPAEAEPGSYTNTTSEITAGDVTGDAASDDLRVVEGDPQQQRADLSITKTDDADPVFAGGTLTYTIEVFNAGPNTATDVVVVDDLPGDEETPLVTLISTSGCLNDPLALSCSLGSIAPGSSTSYTITVQVADGTVGTITNDASVSSSIADGNLENNTTSEDTEVLELVGADLSIEKVDDIDPIEAHSDERLRYTITVTNHGPFDAEDVVVTDTLPTGIQFKETVGCAEDKKGVPTCSLGDLAAGDSRSYTIVVKMKTQTPLGTMTNTASVASSTFDPVAENNTTTEDTLVCKKKTNLQQCGGVKVISPLGFQVATGAATPAVTPAASTGAASPSSVVPSAVGPTVQGGTLPATGSDASSPITLAALWFLAAGVVFVALGRSKRRPASGPSRAG